MSSVGTYTGAVGAGTYSATKGALENMIPCHSPSLSFWPLSWLADTADPTRHDEKRFPLSTSSAVSSRQAIIGRTSSPPPTSSPGNLASLIMQDSASYTKLESMRCISINQAIRERRPIASWVRYDLKAKICLLDFLWVRTQSKQYVVIARRRWRNAMSGRLSAAIQT